MAWPFWSSFFHLVNHSWGSLHAVACISICIFLPTCILLFIFLTSLIRLQPPVSCSMEVIRLDILVFFLIIGEDVLTFFFFFFTIKYNGSYGILLIVLYQVKTFLSIPCLLKVFYIEILDFFNFFLHLLEWSCEVIIYSITWDITLIIFHMLKSNLEFLE